MLGWSLMESCVCDVYGLFSVDTTTTYPMRCDRRLIKFALHPTRRTQVHIFKHDQSIYSRRNVVPPRGYVRLTRQPVFLLDTKWTWIALKRHEFPSVERRSTEWQVLVIIFKLNLSAELLSGRVGLVCSDILYWFSNWTYFCTQLTLYF